MFVPFHDDVISQFEGYCELTELDWEHYRQRYGNIQRLDRILEAENDSVNKQADALGYRFAPEQIPKTIEYYLSRTSHRSTLRAVVHAWVLARANRDMATEYFGQVLDSDIADIQDGTTSQGIQLAAMTGSIDLLQRCFTGLKTRNDHLIVGPQWPEALGPIEFPLVYRGQRLHFRISGGVGALTSEARNARPIPVECRGSVQELLPGHTIEVA